MLGKFSTLLLFYVYCFDKESMAIFNSNRDHVLRYATCPYEGRITNSHSLSHPSVESALRPGSQVARYTNVDTRRQY